MKPAPPVTSTFMLGKEGEIQNKIFYVYPEIYKSGLKYTQVTQTITQAEKKSFKRRKNFHTKKPYQLRGVRIKGVRI